MQKSVRLKSFELIARDINDVDVSLLHALSIGVGWPHRPKDWDFLRRAGHGIVAVDGIGRVFGSAMWFPHGDDFATVGLVITSPRTQAQGNARWLMGPVANRAQYERVQTMIRAGIDAGAKLVCGGLGRPAGLDRGFFTQPTIFSEVRPEMRIAREEIFGPVLAIMHPLLTTTRISLSLR